MNNPLAAFAERVRDASRWLARASSAQKNHALSCAAAALRAATPEILAANLEDLQTCQRDDAFRDRLTLNPDRIEDMARAIEEVITLPDPIGRVDSMWRRPNGLKVGRQRIPLGVVGIIYEARPNVTSDAAALCLKSGNGVILRGGSDAHRTSQAIFTAFQSGLKQSDLDPRACAAIGFVDSPDRESVRQLLELDAFVDVIIPRGGKSLIQFVNTHSRIPVIKHDEGVCHVVVDGSATQEMVDAVVLNAKTHRPTVCNAAETLLVLRNAVEPHLARLLTKLANAGVFLYLDDASLAIAQAQRLDNTCFAAAKPEDYGKEFLSLELAVRVVEDLEEAIEHINQYGSRHTEALLTENHSLVEAFVDAVDSSCVVINASTRFADGNQLGLGAEIGISTTRLHAYGPMGIEELTTTKFVIFGSGQVRS
jgi:glutamate-5-semialdehyde dehydrogenase